MVRRHVSGNRWVVIGSMLLGDRRHLLGLHEQHSRLDDAQSPVVTRAGTRCPTMAPSRLLMPLSYCAIFGGTCTLIGTSTNLLARRGWHGPKRDGTVRHFRVQRHWVSASALVGVIYLMVVAPLSSDLNGGTFSALSDLGPVRFITDAICARRLTSDRTCALLAWPVQEPWMCACWMLLRNSLTLRHEIDEVALQAGDRLVLESPMSEVLSLKREGDLLIGSDDLEALSERKAILVEAVVAPGSRLTGAAAQILPAAPPLWRLCCGCPPPWRRD